MYWNICLSNCWCNSQSGSHYFRRNVIETDRQWARCEGSHIFSRPLTWFSRHSKIRSDMLCSAGSQQQGDPLSRCSFLASWTSKFVRIRSHSHTPACLYSLVKEAQDLPQSQTLSLEVVSLTASEEPRHWLLDYLQNRQCAFRRLTIDAFRWSMERFFQAKSLPIGSFFCNEALSHAFM